MKKILFIAATIISISVHGQDSSFLTKRGKAINATTLGVNMLVLPNPSAVTFPRFNSNNTITARTAAQLRSDIGVTDGSISSLLAATTSNAIDNGNNNQYWEWNTLGNNYGLVLNTTSTAAASNNQTLLKITMSGANATSSQTTYGAQIINNHTGTSSSNVALFLAAGLGTNNYSLITGGGSVGIGTVAPDSLLTVIGGGLHTNRGVRHENLPSSPTSAADLMVVQDTVTGIISHRAIPTGSGGLPTANPAYTGVLTTGTLTYTATNPLATFQSSVNSFNQFIIQNSSNGSSASADVVVNNDVSTNTTFYGDFGMNSSAFSGTGSLNAPSYVYLTSTSSDLAIGTTTANGIHFVVNTGASDVLAFSSTGAVSGSSVASAATASTLVLRDANANITDNNTLEGYTTTATAAGTTTLTVSSTKVQYFTGSSNQTVVMPVTSTLNLNWSTVIRNLSTGSLTINSSGANAIVIIAPGAWATLTCILTSGTTAASWDATYSGIVIATGKKLTVNNTLIFAGTDGQTMTFPAATTTVAGLGTTQTFTGANTFNNANVLAGAATMALFNTTATTITFAGATTTLTIGGTPTGAITHNYSTNATLTATAKTINFATGGASGSTTTINFGSTTGTNVFKFGATLSASTGLANFKAISGNTDICFEDGSGTKRWGFSATTAGDFSFFGGVNTPFKIKSAAPDLFFTMDGTGLELNGTAANSTLHVNGSFSTAYVAKSALYTATATDYTIDCTSGTFTVTLPTAVGITGRIYIISNSGAGTITIGTTSSQTFANVATTPTTLTMATVGSRTVQSNGANWIVLSSL